MTRGRLGARGSDILPQAFPAAEVNVVGELLRERPVRLPGIVHNLDAGLAQMPAEPLLHPLEERLELGVVVIDPVEPLRQSVLRYQKAGDSGIWKKGSQ